VQVTRGFQGPRRPSKGHQASPGQYDMRFGLARAHRRTSTPESLTRMVLLCRGLVRTRHAGHGRRSMPWIVKHRATIHCVTTWSVRRELQRWSSVDTTGCPYDATFRQRATWSPTRTRAHTTSLSLGDVTTARPGWVWITRAAAPALETATRPARHLLVRICLLESAEVVAGLRLLDHDEPDSGRSTAITSRARSLARTALPGRLR